MTELTTTRAVLDRPARSILLSAVLAAVIAVIANSLIAAAAHAAGATASTMGLMPASFIGATIGGVVVGAVGWAVITRYVRRAPGVLLILAAVVFVVSLVPVVGMFAQATTQGDITAAVGLGLLHLVTLSVAVPIYRRFLRRR